ncbi:hypothetical protein MNV_220028 [Candidatus Methanoperedens nitroreducens]|uniref:Uncharacterized protein n=1 Tax=Candidatus Methanoperedens nitratireducens TaxID=1392998 RepID=A0A284VP32_9EURY|nr:hypothetical protein MNV_220028 [Candidatus Methanoperedens nitroreducens]
MGLYYNITYVTRLNYRSPLEVWNYSGVSLGATAGGLWT